MTISSASKSVPGVISTPCSRIHHRLRPALLPFSIFNIDQRCVVVDFAIFNMLVGPLVVAIFDRILLTQGVPRPILGQQNSAQIGMAAELHSEHIEDLALHPVGADPDVRYRRALVAIRERYFYPDSPVIGNRIKEQHNLKLLTGSLRPVSGGQIGAHVELSVAVVVKESTHFDITIFGDAQDLLAERLNGFGYGSAENLFDSVDERIGGYIECDRGFFGRKRIGRRGFGDGSGSRRCGFLSGCVWLSSL